MKTDAYTPDAICRSLGAGAFDDPSEKGRPMTDLRLLLCPSFAPEMLICLSEAGEAVAVRVIAARTQIWHLPSPGLVTSDRATARLEGLRFDNLEQAFRGALAEPQFRGMVMDGMPVHIALRCLLSVVRVETNPGRGMLGGFIADILQRAHQVIDNVRCRNALARAGSYVGLELDIEPEADSPETTTVMVLGTPEDQTEVLSALAAVSARPLPE